MGYRKIIMGIDLNVSSPQICYFDMASRKTGARLMKIGNARVNLTEIFEKADSISDDRVAEVLSGVLREALATVGISDIKREIVGLMFTVEDLSKPMVTLLQKVFALLGISKSRGYMQDYKESVYYYIMYQKQEMWKHNAACFVIGEENDVSFYSLSLNRKTSSVTASVKVEELGNFGDDPETKGRLLAGIIRDTLNRDIYSSVFVTGSDLEQPWALESKKVLVKGGRPAFTEEYIFARGACFGARERADEKRIRGISFAGDSLVRDNIGMNVQVGEKTAYYPLITAGAHWYNARHDCEFILGDQKRVVLVISSSKEGGRRLCRIDLEGLPDRPARTTRIHLHVEFESRNQCTVEVEDMGFGDMFPSCGIKWKEVLEGVR